MERPIRLLIADDHPVVRAGLVAVLGQNPRFAIVGEAGDGQAAVDLAAALLPDVVLMDLRMPVLDGVEATRRIRAAHPAVQVLVLTTYDDDDLVWAGLQAGARGYLLKDAPIPELFRAVEAVAAGQSLLPPAVAAKLVQRIARGAAEPPAEALTERELAILARMAQGMANKEIAAALGISENTVKTHVSHIFAKLGARDRTEAVTWALQRGLIRL